MWFAWSNYEIESVRMVFTYVVVVNCWLEIMLEKPCKRNYNDIESKQEERTTSG